MLRVTLVATRCDVPLCGTGSKDFVVLIDDLMPFRHLAAQSVPFGGIPDYPFLQALQDSLQLDGHVSVFKDFVNSKPELLGLLMFPPPPPALGEMLSLGFTRSSRVGLDARIFPGPWRPNWQRLLGHLSSSYALAERLVSQTMPLSSCSEATHLHVCV